MNYSFTHCYKDKKTSVGLKIKGKEYIGKSCCCDEDTPSEIKDSVLFATIKFDKIEDNDLRELNEKLLNRFVSKRISCKEALYEIKKIKVERENYFRGFKRLSRKTPSVVLRKERGEIEGFMNYWEQMTTNVRNNFEI